MTSATTPFQLAFCRLQTEADNLPSRYRVSALRLFLRLPLSSTSVKHQSQETCMELEVSAPYQDQNFQRCEALAGVLIADT